MLRAFWNWVQSLFYCFFPSWQPDASCREVESLLYNDNDNHDNAANTESDNIAAQHQSSSRLIAHELQKAESLSAEESALIIHYSQLGENDYIDKLSTEKQKQAYQLIGCLVNNNVNKIDGFMKRLLELNPYANRVEASWRRVRGDFKNGDYSEFSMISACNKFISNHINGNAKYNIEQRSFMDQIIETFNLCKTLLRLNICRHAYTRNQRAATPTKEYYLEEIDRTETRMNSKTLTLVNKFNKCGEDYAKENPPKERRQHKGKLYGYN